MSKKEKKAKASNKVDDNLAIALQASFDIDAERVWWEKMKEMVNSDIISIRGVKATIVQVEQNKGNAPTIKSTWSQYFRDAFTVEELKDGKDESLKSIFSTTIQGCRRLGGREAFVEYLEGKLANGEVTCFSDLAVLVNKLEKNENGESDTEILTIDGYASLFMGAKDLPNQLFADKGIADSFFKYVAALSKMNASAAHPALSSKGA